MPLTLSFSIDLQTWDKHSLQHKYSEVNEDWAVDNMGMYQVYGICCRCIL